MAKLEGFMTDFMVVLRNDRAAEDITLLEPIVHSLQLKSGLIANVIWCKTVDPSGQYLHAKAKMASKDTWSEVQIPHHLVLVIAGSKGSPPIGFFPEMRQH